jgi:hypothetical protein
MTTHPMHLFDPAQAGPTGEASAGDSPVSNDTERCFSERVTRDRHDSDRAKEPSPVGRRNRSAHCDSRRADHRAVVHNGDDPS